MKKVAAISVLMSFTMVSCSSAQTAVPSVSSQYTSEGAQASSPAVRGEDIELTMAINGYNPYIINGTDMVEKFNDADNGYKIILKDYAEGMSFEKPAEQETIDAADLQLSLDIMKGEVIDIIPNVFRDMGKYDSLAQKGAFVDLNTFLDSDEEINHETLFDNVLRACELNGKLFYMPLGFTIDTLVGPTKYVGSKENWTFEELKEHWESMPEGSTIARHRVKDYVYFTILRGCLSSFIDYENAECHFDSEEFIDILKFIDSFDNSGGYKDEGTWNAPVFVIDVSLRGFKEFNYGYIQETYGTEEPVTFVGYPSEDGCGTFINVREHQIAVSATSSEEKQRGAWEFMKTLVSYECQCDSLYFEGEEKEEAAFPINLAAFEKRGADQYANEGKSNIIMNNMEEMDEGYLTKAEYDRLVDLINSIKKANNELDNDVFQVIDDEIHSMFEGEKTAEEVADMIQNRVQILVSEKS